MNTMSEPLPKCGEAPPPTRLCALLTTFNRREMTLSCLRALEASASTSGVDLAAIVVDDASTDGTAAAIGVAFPWAQVIAGSGDLFWCRGMHRAFEEALRVGYSHYLWLNDDTLLVPDAIARLLACRSALADTRDAPVIVVGTTVDPETGEPTYGGQRVASRWRPLHVPRLPPADQPRRCESMTGNIALVSAAVASRVGNLDPAFEHAMGDTDYALRAAAAGVEIWVAPGVLGTCPDNDVGGTYRDPSLPLGERWQKMLGRKGLPWRSWLRLARRHGGLLWPLAFAWPYIKVVVGAISARAASRPAVRR
jgi:GT2 family glycosyltransferase